MVHWEVGDGCRCMPSVCGPRRQCLPRDMRRRSTRRAILPWPLETRDTVRTVTALWREPSCFVAPSPQQTLHLLNLSCLVSPSLASRRKAAAGGHGRHLGPLAMSRPAQKRLLAGPSQGVRQGLRDVASSRRAWAAWAAWAARLSTASSVHRSPEPAPDDARETLARDLVSLVQEGTRMGHTEALHIRPERTPLVVRVVCGG